MNPDRSVGDTREYVLDNILKHLYEYLKVPIEENNIIRIHSKKLDLLGDISFPLNIKNWYHLIDRTKHVTTILQYASLAPYSSKYSSNSEPELDISKLGEDSEGESDLCKLEQTTKQWCIKFRNVRIDKDNVHIYLERCNTFQRTIKQCFSMNGNYGALHRPYRIILDINVEDLPQKDQKIGLTNLRMIILQKVLKNLSEFQLHDKQIDRAVVINLTYHQSDGNKVLCGSVVNENDVKYTCTFPDDLYKKRSTDMRLMAEHKYGLRVKSSDSWNEYFQRLGKASVTIELLQNKPHKNVKVTLISANKEPSFIFYNSARLSALFKEFEKKVTNKVYPELVPLDDIDFSLLDQPEEWELLYVYILQYPLLIKSCIKDVEKGIVNPHYLVSFLSNLCSAFSVYYRRIRILIAPKPHLIPTLHARIYLLKALEQIFHKTLELLSIDPVREM